MFVTSKIPVDNLTCPSNRSGHELFDQFQIEHLSSYNYQKFLFIFRVLVFTVELPLDLSVAYVILKTKQLHNPRNAFWLGNIAAHFAPLVMGIYEYWAVVFPSTDPPNEIFCAIYSLLVGFPYTILLVSLLLATADRWFAISDPIKHRKYVTVKGVAGCLVSAWILVLVILTSPYWTGSAQLKLCAVNTDVMKWIMASHFVMAVLIIVGQVSVFIRTRQYLRFKAHRPAADPQPTDVHLPSSNSSLRPDEYFVHLPDKTICRLELESAVTLFFGVASLIFCALPISFVFLILIVCDRINSSQCESTVLAVVPYAREMLLLHSFINTFLYVTRSREFFRASRRIFPRCFSNIRRQPRQCQSPVELRNF